VCVASNEIRESSALIKCRGNSFSVVKWLSCLPFDLRFEASNPAEDDGCFKSSQRVFFGWELQPSAACRKILWHVKDPCGL
jgi:hypothetical protein